MVLVNIVLLNALWFASVLGAASQLLWPAYICLFLLLAVTFVYQGMGKRDWQVIVVSLIFGTFIDGSLMNSGLVVYHAHSPFLPWLPPIWILSLWIGFGASIRAGMQWMLNYPVLGAGFIAVGAPLSYLSAAKLGAIEITQLPQAMAVIGLSWLVYFVFMFKLNQTKSKELANNAMV